MIWAPKVGWGQPSLGGCTRPPLGGHVGFLRFFFFFEVGPGKGRCEQWYLLCLRALGRGECQGQDWRESLTVGPRHAEGLEDGHEQQAHAAGCIVVKELEHVHAALPGEGERQNLTLGPWSGGGEDHRRQR